MKQSALRILKVKEMYGSRRKILSKYFRQAALRGGI
jgi:hypothetical protein